MKYNRDRKFLIIFHGTGTDSQPFSSGPVLPDDAGRGSSDRLSEAGSASLHLLPGAAGSSDQDERQRGQLLHLPDRLGQTDQEQGAPRHQSSVHNQRS